MGWKMVSMMFLSPIDLSIIVVPRVLLIVPYFIQFWLPSIPAPSLLYNVAHPEALRNKSISSRVNFTTLP